MKHAPHLAPKVTEALERWRPSKWDNYDVWTLEPLLPTIRGWVEQAKPGNADQTRRFLLPAAGIAVMGSAVVWQHRPDRGVPPLKHRTVDHVSLRGQVDEVAANHPEQTPRSRTDRQSRRVAPSRTESGPATDRPTVHHA